jgi:hypothetical protein
MDPTDPVAPATNTRSLGLSGPHSRNPKNAVIPEVPNISIKTSAGHILTIAGLNAYVHGELVLFNAFVSSLAVPWSTAPSWLEIN